VEDIYKYNNNMWIVNVMRRVVDVDKFVVIQRILQFECPGDLQASRPQPKARVRARGYPSNYHSSSASIGEPVVGVQAHGLQVESSGA
jgi:hypothetical protein